MAIRSGLAGQLGFAAETTWGTYAAPDHFLEFDSESMKSSIARIESKGLRANNRVLRTDRWTAGKQDVSGDLTFEVANKGFGLLFKHMMGAFTSAADGAGFKWTSAITDPFGLGLTVQVGRPDISGTVQPFSYTGCKVQGWELSNKVDDHLHLKVTLDGKAEATNQSLGAASYPASQELFDFIDGTITIAGASYNITDWSVSNTTGIKQDRYFVGAATKAEQVINAWMTPQVNFTAEFPSLTPYNLYVNGTLANIVLTYATVSTYDTAKPYKLVITLPNVRFDGDTPNVNGTDVTMLNLPGKALFDGTLDAVKIESYTSDSAL